jgi:hypothetical protein
MNNALSPSVSAPVEISSVRLLQKKQLIVLALLVVVRCICLYAIPDDVEKVSGITKVTLPDQFGAWKGKSMEVDPFVYEVLHPEAVLQKRYTLTGPASVQHDPDGKVIPPPVAEVLAMYTRDTEGFHPPDVCMKAQGWVITDHDVRQIKAEGRTLNLEVIVGEQREEKKLLAYCFTDPTGTISGRTETFAKMILARFIRRRVGTVEMQFAYDNQSLLPNGDFSPQLKDLMVQSAADVYRQLSAKAPSKAQKGASPT